MSFISFRFLKKTNGKLIGKSRILVFSFTLSNIQAMHGVFMDLSQMKLLLVRTCIAKMALLYFHFMDIFSNLVKYFQGGLESIIAHCQKYSSVEKVVSLKAIFHSYTF